MNEKKCFLLTCSLLASLISFGFIPVAHAQWVEKALIVPGSFGFSHTVDIDGDLAAVGTGGKVHLFQRHQGGHNEWGLIRTIVTIIPGDGFGSDIALQGDFLLVGAPDTDHSGLDQAGAAYLFERNRGGTDNWGPVKMFVASGASDQANFGHAVALAHETVFIGSPREPYPLRSMGFVYVYSRDQGGRNNWGEVKKIEPIGPAIRENFGYAIAASFDRLLVGDPDYDGTGFPNTLWEKGEAFIFERHYGGTNNWGQVKKLISSDSYYADWFGYAVALHGNDALIGSPKIYDTDAAYVFNRQQGGANQWGQVKKLVTHIPYARMTTESVAIRDDMALLGIPRNSPQPSNFVFRFSRNRFGSNNWGLIEKVRPHDPPGHTPRNFGKSVAIGKDAFIVGKENGRGADSLVVAYLYWLDPCSTEDQPPQVTQTFDEKYRVRFTFSSSIGIRSLDLLNPEQAKMTASEPEPDDMEIGPDGQLHIPFSGNPSSLDITLESTTSEKSLRFNLEVVDICDQITRIKWPEISIKGLEQRPPASAVQLSAPYPNPFNPEARFTLSVPETQHVTVRVYDVLGRVVAHLHDGVLAGNQTYTFRLDARNWASGTYLYQVSGDDFIESRTFVLAR